MCWVVAALKVGGVGVPHRAEDMARASWTSVHISELSAKGSAKWPGNRAEPKIKPATH